MKVDSYELLLHDSKLLLLYVVRLQYISVAKPDFPQPRNEETETSMYFVFSSYSWEIEIHTLVAFDVLKSNMLNVASFATGPVKIPLSLIQTREPTKAHIFLIEKVLAGWKFVS